MISKTNKSNRNTNTDSRYIENEPIRTDKCRKRMVYGKVNRKHRPVRSCPVIQRTQHEYIKIHRQMMVHSHNHNSQPEEGLATTEDDRTPESRPRRTEPERRLAMASGGRDGEMRRAREGGGDIKAKGVGLETSWAWAEKNGISRLVKMRYPDQIREYGNDRDTGQTFSVLFSNLTSHISYWFRICPKIW